MATSSDNSTWVAPGFSYSATLNALRTASVTTSGEAMAVFHFVIGRNMLTTSMFWWLS